MIADEVTIQVLVRSGHMVAVMNGRGQDQAIVTSSVSDYGKAINKCSCIVCILNIYNVKSCLGFVLHNNNH